MSDPQVISFLSLSLDPDPKRRASAETLLKHPYLNQTRTPAPVLSSGTRTRHQQESFTRGSADTPQQCTPSTYSPLRSFTHSHTSCLSKIDSDVAERTQMQNYPYPSLVSSSQPNESCDELCETSPVDLVPKNCSSLTQPTNPDLSCFSSQANFNSRH